MTSAARLLARALAEPASVETLAAPQWTALLAAARAEQLIGSLAWRLDGPRLPESVTATLADARASAEQGRLRALWEAEMARRALVPLGVPLVLLKGTAYVAAGLDAGVGRSIGDLDILVPRDALDRVEAALLEAGWEWVKPDPYDNLYYRRWMHELPPLIHTARDRMIDVHHTILPLTARLKPDAAMLIAKRVPLGDDGLSVLSPEHMVLHAATHLFADGDLAGGLRNLWDIDRLLREFAGRHDDFYLSVVDAARSLNLGHPLMRALRLAAHVFETPIPSDRSPFRLSLSPELLDHWFVRRLFARDGWGRATRPATRFGFYLRSHWLRMPPLMLARHLWIKANR